VTAERRKLFELPRVLVVAMGLEGFTPRRPGFGRRSGHVRFVVDKVALGQVFFKDFGVSYQLIPIPPIAPHSSSSPIIRGWYDRPNSGRRTKWTQSRPIPREEEGLRGT
jgi:hypothetical protein